MSNTQQTPIIPNHLGLILDGNRRWAKQNGLPTLEGHRQGYKNLETIVEAAFEMGIKYVSAYVFSTENWQRTEDEIKGLFGFIHSVAAKTIENLVKNNVRICILGSREGLSKKLQKLCDTAEEKSRNNTGGILALCFNYGGQQEITDAVKKIAATNVDMQTITSDLIANYLYHPEIPPVDFLIRTSGEERISNFMLWRLAYSELCFSDKYWPDFSKTDLKEALGIYIQRSRRFGE